MRARYRKRWWASKSKEGISEGKEFYEICGHFPRLQQLGWNVYEPCTPSEALGIVVSVELVIEHSMSTDKSCRTRWSSLRICALSTHINSTSCSRRKAIGVIARTSLLTHSTPLRSLSICLTCTALDSKSSSGAEIQHPVTSRSVSRLSASMFTPSKSGCYQTVNYRSQLFHHRALGSDMIIQTLTCCGAIRGYRWRIHVLICLACSYPVEGGNCQRQAWWI